MTSHTTPAGPTGGRGAARRRLLRELLLVAGLFAVYKAGRLLSTDRTDDAFGNAARVWDAERALRLPSEGTIQRLLLQGAGDTGAPTGDAAGDILVHAANTYYAAVHFPATALFLVWLYLRKPRHYRWARRVLTVLTGAALALHLAFPLAPPRMLAAAHLVDTGQAYGPSVYGASPAADTLANQFAAMPSLHFGWALVLALGMIAAGRTRSPWHLLWLLHPLLTLLVIVGTANHYWLDAIVSAALLGAALLAVPGPQAPSRPRVAVRHLPRARRAAARAERAASAEPAEPAGAGR
ncbi:inositol phosphorylceramide synthase [Streptomyces sp. BR123]|uniref:phosphatase PAP2 family protein n=1 Tax=Streptomyces sp. BR123 TaxID=2749828 RepID=UPI0015C4AF2F|nr:phosphatase PAP2 family protein [Streptomyces sp. BR123]NXY93306.1 inositol phosphorylceramide synthase [Streptomyces sp. BR123]